MIPALLLPLALAAAPLPQGAPAGAPAAKTASLALDPKDGLPVLVGPCTREEILRHREVFGAYLAADPIAPAWKARWQALDAPCVVVAVFGSWCDDSHRELPDLLGLLGEPNPFVEVRLVGVLRDRKAPPAVWPKGVAVPAVERVPTFWVYAQLPGGGYRLMGSIVEAPPVKGQRMAEAILNLLELARRL